MLASGFRKWEGEEGGQRGGEEEEDGGGGEGGGGRVWVRLVPEPYRWRPRRMHTQPSAVGNSEGVGRMLAFCGHACTHPSAPNTLREVRVSQRECGSGLAS